jgi:glycosyltransferase involved in cell wall biosynthesis
MAWYTPYLSVYGQSFDEEKDATIINDVRERLAKLQSDEPIATVSIICYNEEKHLLACLWALSRLKTQYPIEIIGVDNNSKDRTADIFKALNVPYFTETKQSPGYARLCGLNNAKGKYHINIDADTLYPEKYAEIMIKNLEKKGVVGVCSLWSYYPDEHHSWLGLKLYEGLRDFHLWLQSFKRPELSVRGMVFAYDAALARKGGIRVNLKRGGDDGSLTLELKKQGKIKFIHCRKARPVTGYGTMSQDGSFLKSFWVRAKKGFKAFGYIFKSLEHYKDEDSNKIDKTDSSN